MVEDEDFMTYFESWQPAIDSDGYAIPVTLFTIKARHDPDDVDVEDLPTIARIELTSELIRSTFGDDRLFFQHESFSRDMARLLEDGEEGEARSKLWRRNTPSHDVVGLGVWGDSPIAPLPEDNFAAMEIIEDGMFGEHECPFAWLLAAL